MNLKKVIILLNVLLLENIFPYLQWEWLFSYLACFESMKTKTCKRTECKFFHTTGTKKEEPASVNSGCNVVNYSNTNGNNFNSNNPSTSGTQQASQSQVFQEVRQPWEIAIERMSCYP